LFSFRDCPEKFEALKLVRMIGRDAWCQLIRPAGHHPTYTSSSRIAGYCSGKGLSCQERLSATRAMITQCSRKRDSVELLAPFEQRSQVMIEAARDAGCHVSGRITEQPEGAHAPLGHGSQPLSSPNRPICWAQRTTSFVLHPGFAVAVWVAPRRSLSLSPTLLPALRHANTRTVEVWAERGGGCANSRRSRSAPRVCGYVASLRRTLSQRFLKRAARVSGDARLCKVETRLANITAVAR
jgi:hypothetical protein